VKANASSGNIVVSGSAGLLASFHDDRAELHQVGEDRPRTVRAQVAMAILGGHNDVVAFAADQFDEARARRDRDWQIDRALQLFLILLDPDMPDTGTAGIAESLERCLDDENVSRAILRHMLCDVLPDVAAVGRAGSFETMPNLTLLATLLVAVQPKLRDLRVALRDAIARTQPELQSGPELAAELSLVMELFANNDVIRFSPGLSPSLRWDAIEAALAAADLDGLTEPLKSNLASLGSFDSGPDFREMRLLGPFSDLVASARKRGRVTYAELDAALQLNRLSSEQIDEVLEALSEMGIDLEYRAAGRDAAPEDEESEAEPAVATRDTVNRTEDTAHMYLREMGAVELLSREGETASVKRIEAARSVMIRALCGSPITFDAIAQWSNMLDEGAIQLRELVDPEARRTDASSVTKTEAQLETFARIASIHRRFQELGQQRLAAVAAGGHHPPAEERRYQELREQLTAATESIPLHEARIEYLVDKHYGYNRRLTTLGGQMLRLAERHRVPRNAFVEAYLGHELDEGWAEWVGGIDEKWNAFSTAEAHTIERIRSEISEISRATGVTLGEFRQIVDRIQKGEREARIAKKEMVEANLRLVISIAKEHSNLGLQFLDLIQEGHIGLMKAVDTFDYRRGYGFSSHAASWIRQAIRSALAGQTRTHHLPVHMIETINKLVRTRRQILHEIGREPTPEELAERLSMPLEKVREVMKIAEEPISLETPIGDEVDSHLGDFIEDKNAVIPVDATIQSNLKETVTRVLASLTPREERVLRMRFGIGMNTDHTLEEVGQQFAIARERIRQIEAKALRKLTPPRRARAKRSSFDA
jgi:RNA polymerase primary sigma factor